MSSHLDDEQGVSGSLQLQGLVSTPTHAVGGVLKGFDASAATETDIKQQLLLASLPKFYVRHFRHVSSPSYSAI